MVFLWEGSSDERKQVLSRDYGLKLSREMEKEMESMSGIERYWRELGEEKGMERGALEERIRMVRNMQGLGFATDIIAKAAELSVEDIQEILSTEEKEKE